MSKLKAVSLRRVGSDHEVSFRGESVEDMIPGERGRVTLLGGPSFHGAVREARALPLGQFRVPNPTDRTPEQLQRRSALGRELSAIAALGDPEPQPEAGSEVAP